MKFEIHQDTNIGSMRKLRGNQDCIKVVPRAPLVNPTSMLSQIKSFVHTLLHPNRCGYVLAALGDGSGDQGAQASEVACETSVEIVDSYLKLQRWDHSLVSGDEIATVISDAISSANEELFGMNNGREDSGFTTLDLLVLTTTGQFFVGHVGDSRVYRLGEEKLEQITEDSTRYLDPDIKQPMSYEDKIYYWQLRSSPSSLGRREKVDVHSYRGEFRKGDSFLMVSDGIHTTVTHDEMVEILEESPYPAGEMVFHTEKPEGVVGIITRRESDTSEENQERVKRMLAGSDNASAIIIKTYSGGAPNG